MNKEVFDNFFSIPLFQNKCRFSKDILVFVFLKKSSVLAFQCKLNLITLFQFYPQINIVYITFKSLYLTAFLTTVNNQLLIRTFLKK
jgi:hypothetical protein